MTKQQFDFKDLSSKELELLKEKYIELKVKSMNQDELIDFATENISLQIKSTIGNDEEFEAWQEMEKFFKDEFEKIIRDIKMNLIVKKGDKGILNEDVNFKNEIQENKKLDMWED